ncbi:hypothetical protein A7K99_10890 [Tatumella citrea]|uniref:Uncharacterized protein n=1 Tax=Tatumella citrea TaxID=53336 RepID=A0A1Y0LKD6_TATCI|nr:hypothetical protein A7K98_10890 [Tatumella citrea]ARU98275.1 hypothetical protein A7K99_10890 [Tatumella citrea]
MQLNKVGIFVVYLIKTEILFTILSVNMIISGLLLYVFGYSQQFLIKNYNQVDYSQKNTVVFIK